MKSTTYGPIGVWRRKIAPFEGLARSADPMIRPAPVGFPRRHRARTRCFVETCQPGAFARSAITDLVFPAPSPTLPRKRGRERTEFVRGRALSLLLTPALIFHATKRAHDLPLLRGHRLHR